MLVPGVSGGSMAMILGIYDKLVSSVSSFRKHKRESFFFLALFSIGGGLGMLLFANPLLSLIERYPMPMLYFFLGAVAGGVPLIFKQAEIKSFSWKVPLYITVGLLVVALFAILPAGAFQSEMEAGVISPAPYADRVYCGSGAGLAGNQRFLSAPYHGAVRRNHAGNQRIFPAVSGSIGNRTAPWHCAHYEGIGARHDKVPAAHLFNYSRLCNRLHGGGFPGDTHRARAASQPAHAGGWLLRNPAAFMEGNQSYSSRLTGV